MKKILAIGGAVIKTARDELRQVIEQDKVEMIIHNGGSLFHDFQLAIDDNLTSHSYPLDDLLDDYECNREASELIWKWYRNMCRAPEGSITRLCFEKLMPTSVFTILGADFWHLFDRDWEWVAGVTRSNFNRLCDRFKNAPFHFVNMGSAVVHPEIFVKALAVAKPKNFKADVVDFLDMYRPRTRVAKYGKYYKMTHKEYLDKLIGEKRR